MPASKQDSQRAILASAAKVLETEIVALQSLRDSLGVPFCAAVVSVGAGARTGGDDGHGQEAGILPARLPRLFLLRARLPFSSTLLRRGHGDLGMITQGDAVLALSNSGETAELRAVLEYTHRIGTP